MRLGFLKARDLSAFCADNPSKKALRWADRIPFAFSVIIRNMRPPKMIPLYESAVHAQRLPGDKRGLVGGQVKRGVGHVFRGAEAPQGGAFDDPFVARRGA